MLWLKLKIDSFYFSKEIKEEEKLRRTINEKPRDGERGGGIENKRQWKIQSLMNCEES